MDISNGSLAVSRVGTMSAAGPKNATEDRQSVRCPPPARTPPRRRWIAAAGVACAVFLMIELIAAPVGLGPVDDAFISLRYATHWGEGLGLCFNPGERVEGYTNFLLVLFQAIAIRCGLDPVRAMSLPPVAALAVLGGVLVLFASRHLFPACLSHAVAAALIITLNPIMVCWAVGGMESCLYALLVLVAFALLVGRGRTSPTMLSPVVLVAAGLARPEAAALCPVAMVVVFLDRRSIRDVVRYAAVFGAGFGAYFALRAAYFGQLFPNTFYAKLDYGNELLFRRGLLYLWDFARSSPLTWLFAVVAAAGIRRAPRWVGSMAAATAVQVGVVAYEGGDHFAMFRFIVPVVPLLGLLSLYGMTTMVRRFAGNAAAGNIAILAGLAALAVSSFGVCRQIKRGEPRPVTQYLRFLQEVDYARQWSEIGRWLGRHAPPEESVATIAIGAVGHYSGLRVVDPHGLIDPFIAHQRRRLGAGYAGHEKFDIDRVLSQRPGYILLVNTLTLESIPEAGVADALWGDFAPSLYGDPRLAQRYRYTNIAMRGRWLNLYVRRDLPDVSTRATAIGGA